MTNINLTLFSASISLAGFMALLLFFLWQTLDNYIGNYKSALTSILECYNIQKNTDPSMYSKIQSIGKDIEKDKQYEKKIIDSYSLSTETNNAVSEIFRNIEQFIILRQKVTRYGLIDISYWMGYAILCLCNIYIWNTRCFHYVQYVVSSALFIIGICFTTYLLWISLKNVGLKKYIKEDNKKNNNKN